MANVDVQISRRYPTFIGRGIPNCATTDPEIFFPERGTARWEGEAVRRICHACPYQTECLDWAIEHSELGIWGGTTEQERRKLRRMRKSRKSA
jgi:WhiB family redox-sensing transcriptional regulator